TFGGRYEAVLEEAVVTIAFGVGVEQLRLEPGHFGFDRIVIVEDRDRLPGRDVVVHVDQQLADHDGRVRWAGDADDPVLRLEATERGDLLRLAHVDRRHFRHGADLRHAEVHMRPQLMAGEARHYRGPAREQYDPSIPAHGASGLGRWRRLEQIWAIRAPPLSQRFAVPVGYSLAASRARTARFPTIARSRRCRR